MLTKHATENAGNGGRMVLGATIMLAGVLAGAMTLGGRTGEAFAGNAPHESSWSLPAISLSAGQVALVKEAGGRFLLIDTLGNAVPIKIKDISLRDSPGDSIVFAP